MDISVYENFDGGGINYLEQHRAQMRAKALRQHSPELYQEVEECAKESRITIEELACHAFSKDVPRT